MDYITINHANIDKEHICCAFSDKKCSHSYELKKDWLKSQFESGFVFRRLDARAKVFLEYGPAENAWVPVTAPNHLMLGCFWVSGQYKGQGHAKALLQAAIADATTQKKDGLVAIVGTKKYHFMSETKWLLSQGFVECDRTPSGFSLLHLNLTGSSAIPFFNEQAKLGTSPEHDGYTVYYTNRCPYTDYHVNESLAETAQKRNLQLKVVHLKTLEQAQSSPTPATIFSLFHNGKFLTTDLSVCMDSRFDKIVSSSSTK